MEKWLEIYMAVNDQTVRADMGTGPLRMAPAPEPRPGYFEAQMAEWRGQNWFGRVMKEDFWGQTYFRRLYAQELGEAAGERIMPSEMDVTGLEEYQSELWATETRAEYEVKRAILLQRKEDIRQSNMRKGFMHKFTAHLLDPTIVIGAGVGAASLGAGALRAGLRVAATEAAIVGTTEGIAAGRYADRKAEDAVRFAAYAAIFGGTVGSFGAAIAGGKVGGMRVRNMWAGQMAGAEVRESAAAARATVLDVVAETNPGTTGRIERVRAVYDKPRAALRKRVEKLNDQIKRAQEKWQIDDLSDEGLTAAYEAGGRSERVAVHKLRKAILKRDKLLNEDKLFNIEEAAGITAKSADQWKSTALAALMGTRKGMGATMLPRIRAVSKSFIEDMPGRTARPVAEAVAEPVDEAVVKALDDLEHILERGRFDNTMVVVGREVHESVLTALEDFYASLGRSSKGDKGTLMDLFIERGYDPNAPLPWRRQWIRNFMNERGALSFAPQNDAEAAALRALKDRIKQIVESKRSGLGDELASYLTKVEVDDALVNVAKISDILRQWGKRNLDQDVNLFPELQQQLQRWRIDKIEGPVVERVGAAIRGNPEWPRGRMSVDELDQIAAEFRGGGGGGRVGPPEPGQPPTWQDKAAGIVERMRQAARQMTKSHGLDDVDAGDLVGASVEDLHLQEITQMLRRDEDLRTLAIRSLADGWTQGTFLRHIKNDVVGWGLRKTGELPHVLSGGHVPRRLQIVSTEDMLEAELQRIADHVGEGGNLKAIDTPQAVKDLYLHRRNEFQRMGNELRELELTYVQRRNLIVWAETEAELNIATRELDELEAGRWPLTREGDRPAGTPSPAVVEKARERVARLEGDIDDLDAAMEAYKRAVNEKYSPVRLVADKVRQDKEGFIEKAMEHFLANPVVKLRSKKGAVRRHPTALDEASRRGRALALWHATVNRVDFSGRPVSQVEFIRRLDEAIEEIGTEFGVRNPMRDGLELEPALERLERELVGASENERVGITALRSLLLRRQLIEGSSMARANGGRYMQSELFETAALDPKIFRKYIEDRPTVQYRSYVERELRRIHAARMFGDPDGMNPIHASMLELDEIKAAGAPTNVIRELEERIGAYDLLRRQMMGEPVVDSSNRLIDNMNRGVDFFINLSTATDLGMAGWSVSVDLAQMLGYYGMGPKRLLSLAKAMKNDKELWRIINNPAVSWQLGVAGEVVRGARMRAVQGGDMFFGGGEGFIMTGRYFRDVLSWFNHTYQEAASNIMTASLLNPITDQIQKLAAPLATTRIMQAAIKVAQNKATRMDRNILRRLGMSDDMARQVYAAFADGERTIIQMNRKAGEATAEELLDEAQTMILPKFETWKDKALAQQVTAMIGGDIRTATLHPSIAANRVWKGMGPGLLAVSRLYYLFSRWAFMAQTNIYAKNIEDRTYRQIANTMLYATAVQMVVNWLKEPDWVEEPLTERALDAFVMSGALGYMGILNERMERLSGHSLGLRPMLGLDTFANDPNHAGFRMSGLSPVAGKLGGIYEAADAQKYGRLLRFFAPYQNWWLWASAVRDGSEILDVEDD